MLTEEDVQLECWDFHREGIYRMMIQDLEEDFHEELKEPQAREVGMIPAGIYIEKDTSLRIFMRGVYTTEVLNKGLENSVIEANNRWRNRGKRRGAGDGISIIEMNTQVETPWRYT